MKNFIRKHKLELIVLLFVILLNIIIFSIVKINDNGNKKRTESNVTDRIPGEPIDPYTHLEEGEEFVLNKDALTLGTEKIVDNYSFVDFKLVDGQDKNRFILKIGNNSGQDIAENEIRVELYGEFNNVLDTIPVYIPEIPNGESLALTGFTKVDMREVYDYKVTFVE